MKTTSFCKVLSLAAVALVAASCQNDVLVEEYASVSSSGSTVTLTCNVGGKAQSRASVSLGNTDTSAEYFQWNEGDSFSLFDLGSDGSSTPTSSATFYISSDYSDDSPSSSATFTGECDFTDGNSVVAVYPAQSSIGSDGTLTLAVSSSSAMGTNSDDEITAYMVSNMFLYGTGTLSGSTAELGFSHLTAMARISLTNSSSSSQTVTSVGLSGDDAYFGTECSFSLVGASASTSATASGVELTFDGVTVAAGETAEFYLLFFAGSEFNSGGSLTVTVNDVSVSMDTDDILTSNFTAGYRYKFNVSLTDDGLAWTNGGDDSTVIIYASDNAPLCEYLAGYFDEVTLDDDGNAIIPMSVIKETTWLDVGGDMVTLSGLEYFVYLEYLYLSCDYVTSVDLSSFTALKYLFCSNCCLTELDVSNNTALTTLYCGYNKLTELDLSNNTALTYLSCGGNYLLSLNVSNCASLESLSCSSSYFESLDLSDNAMLTYLECVDCSNLTSLDLSANTEMTSLSCNNCSSLTSLDLSANTKLTTLYVNDCTNLADLDLSSCSSLTDLGCSDCSSITSLDLSGCSSLKNLYCASNKNITSLDLSDCPELYYLYCWDSGLTSLDISSNTKLGEVYVSDNDLTTLTLPTSTSLTALYCSSNKLTALDITSCPNIVNLYCGNQVDDNDDSQVLTLTLNETQAALWEYVWGYGDDDGDGVDDAYYVTLSVVTDDSSSGTSGDDYKDGSSY